MVILRKKQARTICRWAKGEGESESKMIKPKRTAEQQVADEADRRALNPLALRQTISDRQAEPEFQANHKRLRADRLARETAEPKANGNNAKPQLDELKAEAK